MYTADEKKNAIQKYIDNNYNAINTDNKFEKYS